MDKPHKKLRVWKLGMQLVEKVYRVTGSFPPDERFGLVSQMRRCAVSIPSNIAEGSARNGKNELRNYLHIAQASLSELDTQFEIALMLKYMRTKVYNEINMILVEEDKMLTGFIRSLGEKG